MKTTKRNVTPAVNKLPIELDTFKTRIIDNAIGTPNVDKKERYTVQVQYNVPCAPGVYGPYDEATQDFTGSHVLALTKQAARWIADQVKRNFDNFNSQVA